MELKADDAVHCERKSMDRCQVDEPVNTSAPHLYKEDTNGRVIGRLLLPCPTDDPRDPLTWRPLRKHLAFGSSCFFIFLSNYITSSITPILVNITQELDISNEQAGWLISFNLLFLGIGNLFWVPLSYKIGKRPVLLLCTCLFFVSSIWSAVYKSYGSLFGARIVQGFAASASEALGPAIVADLYFLHERGLWVGVYTLCFTIGTSLGGIFAGLIAATSANVRWVFWMNAILTGTLFLVTILLQAETTFKRPAACETGEGMEPSQLAAIQAQANSSWLKSLTVTSYYDRDVSLLHLWWRPWLTLRYPALIWGSLTYGVCLGWLVLQLTANGVYFPAIYNYNSQAVGNISLSYLVASLIGCVAGGPISDWIVAIITKRRKGYFEPEFRLWCLVPSFLLAPVGLMLWGCGLENRMPPMVAIVGNAITYGVLCAVPTIAITYIVDSYRPLAGETSTILNAFKNTFAFGLSFAVFPWLERDGFVKVSAWNLLIEGIIFATSIPLYIYGGRVRRWTAKFVM